MQVTEVDAGLLQYQSLEELSLTGNLLKTVRGEHLPPQLKVGSHTHVAHVGGKVVYLRVVDKKVCKCPCL